MPECQNRIYVCQFVVHKGSTIHRDNYQGAICNITHLVSKGGQLPVKNTNHFVLQCEQYSIYLTTLQLLQIYMFKLQQLK